MRDEDRPCMDSYSKKKTSMDDTIADVNCGASFVTWSYLQEGEREGAASASSVPPEGERCSYLNLFMKRKATATLEGVPVTWDGVMDKNPRADKKIVEGTAYRAYVAFNDWLRASDYVSN